MFVRILIMMAVAAFVWTAFVRPATSHAPRQLYVVKPYDTLWSIAATRYAGDLRDAVYRIQQANHLEGGVLRVGQSLVLP